MKLSENIYLLIISLLFTITNSHAMELQQGIQYSSGADLTASQAGINFVVPDGWSGSVTDEGGFIMSSSQHYGMLILNALPTNNRQQMANNLTQESLDIGSGFIFYPSGNANIESDGVTQNYQGKDPTAGTPLMGHLHVLDGAYGQSVTIVVVGKSKDSNYNNHLLHNTLNNISFFNPQSLSQKTKNHQQPEMPVAPQQDKPVIENWSGGGYVEGVNSQGQKCSYVTAGGMSMKSCD